MIFSILTSLALAAFPESWSGRWQGPCDVPAGLTMTLRIAPQGDRHTWEVTYREGQAAPQTRPYELMTIDARRGHFAVDERNGIIIDSYFAANTLRSLFSVGSKVLATRYELSGNRIRFEGPAYLTQPVRITRAGQFEVRAFPLDGDQRCVLERTP